MTALHRHLQDLLREAITHAVAAQFHGHPLQVEERRRSFVLMTQRWRKP
ncbi:MAG: hypothetical protein LC623_05340 [Halobacteriales archaeon]|nr:hypothetical protein [Halobacteriales archaeon]